MCVRESEREGEIEGLCERENKEIDENNVRNEKWTKEWMKYGIETLFVHIPRGGAGYFPGQSTKDVEDEVASKRKRREESISCDF